MTEKAKRLGEQFSIPANIDLGDGNGALIYGLTKREYFAAMAMQGLMVNSNTRNINLDIEAAIEAADALLEELCK